MKKTLWIFIAVVAMLAVPGCRKEPAGEAQAQQRLEEAQKRLEEAEQQAAEARRQLEEAQQKAAQAEQQRQLEEARRKLDQAQKQAAEARRQVAEAQQKAVQAKEPAGTQTTARESSGSPTPASSSVAPPPAPKPVTLPAGTQVVVRTTTAISTKDMKTGEHFAATLQQPLVVDGLTLAPKGAEVEGIVVESDPGGRVKGLAEIGIALRSIQTAAGKVEIQTGTYVAQARSSVKKDVTRGAIMTGVGAAVGAIAGGGRGAAVGAGVGAGAGTATAMATRGEPATIPAESVLTFQLKSPVTVAVK